MSEKLVLIDLSGIAHPLWHVNDGNPNPNATSIAIVERIRAMASAHRHVAICCDSGKSFRAEIDPTYKAQRPESDARLMHQIALAVETLRGDGFPIWAAKGFEADDVIASAVKSAETSTFVSANGATVEILPRDVLIISPDKDLRQLVSDRVEVLAPGIADRPAKTYDSEAVFLRHGVQPHQLLDYFALVGDASDNIKGADGIGEKKAAAMLHNFGNLDDIMAALSSDTAPFTPSTRKSLMEFRPRMDTVRSLIRLRTDAPIKFEQIFKERVPLDVAVFSEGDYDMGDGVQTGTEPMDDIGYSMQTLDEKLTEVVKPEQSQPAIEWRDTQTHHAPLSVGKVDKEPKQSLVVQPAPPEWERGLEPRDMNDAVKLADRLMASRLFSAYGHPAGILATVLAGREFGIPAMSALRAFQIVEGKPSQSADLIRALVLKSPHCEYFRIVERTAERATWVTKRKGNPEVSLTYTIEEGRAAWQKDQRAWDASAWGKRPANMVTKTGSSALARLVYPDVVMNMYCREELSGDE